MERQDGGSPAGATQSMLPTFDVLVAGLGNELRCDDGIGMAAARELERLELPSGVGVFQAGSSLVSAVGALAASRQVIFVDAVSGGGQPGDIWRIDLPDGETHSSPRLDSLNTSHELGMAEALAEARLLTGFPKRALVIGMEPLATGPGYGLSGVAQSGLPRLVATLVAELRAAGHVVATPIMNTSTYGDLSDILNLRGDSNGR